MNKQRIGIVGGGQLGRMLAQSARKLGFFVTVLDPGDNCPASQVADAHILGSFKDKDKILELASVSDFITFEIESANAEALEELVARGTPVHPSPKTLKIIKDKFEQKVFLSNHNIATSEFALLKNTEDAFHQGQIFTYPFLIKTRFDAYDGRGNFVVKNEDDICTAFKKFENQSLYCEKFFPFTKELAVVSARSMDGSIITFPVVETIHKNNICHIVRSPASVSKIVQDKARDLALSVMKALEGVGVMAVEMFLDKDDNVVVNEIAPRVHNSGHHTIEAFDISQFDAHIRAITGMHLKEPEALSRASVMVNILGEDDKEALLDGNYKHDNSDGVQVHIYGKLQTRKERKMGHITALADTTEEAEQKALNIRKNLEI